MSGELGGENRLMTRREVARRLNICTHTVARMTRKGELPVIRLNSRLLRYRVADVERLLSNGSYEHRAEGGLNDD